MAQEEPQRWSKEIHSEKSAFHSCSVPLLGGNHCYQFLMQPSRYSDYNLGGGRVCNRKEEGLSKPQGALLKYLWPRSAGFPQYTKLYPPNLHVRITLVVSYCFQWVFCIPPKFCSRRRPANHYSSSWSLFWTPAPWRPHLTSIIYQRLQQEASAVRVSQAPWGLVKSKHFTLKYTTSGPKEKCFAKILLENKKCVVI